MYSTINIISFIESVWSFHRKSIQIVIKICQDMLLSLQKYLIILLNSNKKIWIMLVPRAMKFEFRQHKNYISSKKWIMRCRQNSLASFENIFIMSSKSDWCYLALKENYYTLKIRNAIQTQKTILKVDLDKIINLENLMNKDVDRHKDSYFYHAIFKRYFWIMQIIECLSQFDKY